MKLILILMAILISGCIKEEKTPPTLFFVDKRLCIQSCRAWQFKSFHSRGEDWGTSSSSMNGLSQSEIYKVVTEDCTAYFKDKKCCMTTRWGSDRVIRPVDGIGECLL